MVELSEMYFQLFRDEARYWIRQFGLLDWKVDFAFEQLKDCNAECRVNLLGKIAVLVLNKWPDMPRDEDEIERHAFHEVCELLLTELEYHTVDNDIPQEERTRLVEIARHGIIRRLENSVLKMKRNG